MHEGFRMTCSIYHNPRCGKSRAALKALEEAKVQSNIVLYLEKPLTIKEIRDLLQKLQLQAKDVIRTKEAIFQEKFKGKNLTEQECIQALHEYPILLERPIVVKGDKAWIVRSEEALNALLG